MFWNRLLKRKVRNIPFEWVRFLTDSVLLPEQDMKQKDTGEQDIIKSQNWLKNTKNLHMKHGWRIGSGEDYICNMQMISWLSKGVANPPLDLLFYNYLLSKTKNVWLFDTLHQKDSAYRVLHPLTKIVAKSKSRPFLYEKNKIFSRMHLLCPSIGR